MLELVGKYNKAKVFTDNIEEKAMSQIIELCNQEIYKDCIIRIMPDTHAGAGCTIGTTMTIKDKLCVNLVGVDIGCGMRVVNLGKVAIDFEKLDNFIRDNIPNGQNINDSYEKSNGWEERLKQLKCYKKINKDRALKSIGTLGGGNHFIEIDSDEEGNRYLIIHTGSRYLGKQVAEYYHNLAYEQLTSNSKNKQAIIQKLKKEGKEKEIREALLKLKTPKIKKDLAYLQGKDLEDYLHDMKIVQDYAKANREKIAEKIVSFIGIREVSMFETIHNYIDLENMILRKGAISSQKNEVVLIPLNMRDGCIIGKGLGNADWNYSACHGAGRIMSRSKAKEMISLEEFKETMQGVWSTSVKKETLDESPMVYKPKKEIVENLKESIEIIKIIKPLYNFKAN